MKELILILGGARSGKSDYAQQLATRLAGDRVLFCASAEALDDDMARRIERHRDLRPPGWMTIEEPRAIAAAIDRAGRERSLDAHVVIIDCLTLWVSNLMHGCENMAFVEESMRKSARELLDVYSAGAASWIVVSNEVGQGIVPANPLARVYADTLGTVNRRIAASADRVVLMVAGVAVDVKQFDHEIVSDGGSGITPG